MGLRLFTLIGFILFFASKGSATDYSHNFTSLSAIDSCPAYAEILSDSVSYCSGQSIQFMYRSDSLLDAITVEGDEIQVNYGDDIIKIVGQIDTGFLFVHFILDTCDLRDSIFIYPGTLGVPFFDLTEKCAEDTLARLLAVQQSVKYQWMPDMDLTDSSNPTAGFYNTSSLEYILFQTDLDSICRRSDTIISEVYSIEYEFEKEFTVPCIAEDVRYTLESEDQVDTVLWIGTQPTRSILNIFDFQSLQDSLLYPVIISKGCAFPDTLFIPRTKPELLFKDLDEHDRYCLGDTGIFLFDFKEDYTIVNGPRYTQINDTVISMIADGRNKRFVIAFGDCVENYDIVLKTDTIPKLDPLSDNINICSGDSLILINKGNDLNLFPDRFTLWQTPDRLLRIGDTLIIENPINGYYSRTVLNGACSYSDSVLVNLINPEFTPQWTDTTLCDGNTVSLSLSDLQADQWIWSNESIVSCTDCREVEITPGGSENFFLEFTEQGCSQRVHFSIEVINNTIIDLGELLLCAGESEQFILPDSISSGTWESNSALNCTECDDPIINPESDTELRYFTTLISCPLEATLSVMTLDTPEIILAIPQGPFTVGDIIDLSAAGQNNNISFLWIRDELERINTQNYSFTIEDTITGIQLIATDESNLCQSTRNLSITAEEKNEESEAYAFPNVFSPNGDFVNDIFRAARSSNTTQNLQIFNRWGKMILNTSDQWDGTTLDGSPAPPDIYFYQAEAIDINGESIYSQGHVTLIR